MKLGKINKEVISKENVVSFCSPKISEYNFIRNRVFAEII